MDSDRSKMYKLIQEYSGAGMTRRQICLLLGVSINVVKYALYSKQVYGKNVTKGWDESMVWSVEEKHETGVRYHRVTSGSGYWWDDGFDYETAVKNVKICHR